MSVKSNVVQLRAIPNELPELRSGDWFELKYGDYVVQWYVLGVSATSVIAGNPLWLTFSTETFSFRQIATAAYLGRGKPRWWWRFVPWRELIPPFSKPRGARK